MTRQEISVKLKDLLAVVLGNKKDLLDSVTEESNLVNDLGLNSVGVLYVVIAIEEYFGIRFDDVSFADFATVKDVLDYIQQKVQ